MRFLPRLLCTTLCFGILLPVTSAASTDTEYTKNIVLWPSPFSSTTPLGANPLFPSDTPYFEEQWSGYLGERTVFMQRHTLLGGKRIYQRLDIFDPGNTLGLYPEETYLWMGGKQKNIPICIGLVEPTTADSGIAWPLPDATTHITDISTALWALQSTDLHTRQNGLRAIQSLKDIADVSTSTLSRFRIFRSDMSSYSETGSSAHPVGYELYTVDMRTARLRQDELYLLDDQQKPSLSERKRYLLKKLIPEANSATLFEPSQYGLANLWSLLPITRSQLEKDPSIQGCYLSGKRIAKDYGGLLDIGIPLANRSLMIQIPMKHKK